MARSILIVEDDEDQLERMSMLLEMSGFKVRAARSIAVGLTLIREERPTLLLLDYNLPDSKGSTMIEKIQVDPELKGVPIVILTSESSPELADQLLEMGASAFVTKTESNAVILNTIERLARSFRKEPEETPEPS